MSKQPSKDKILPSELRILKLIWDGYYCKAVADKLCISIKTLYTELRNARKRNNLKTNFSLLRFAVEEGLLPLNLKICIVQLLVAASDIFSVIYCSLSLS